MANLGRYTAFRYRDIFVSIEGWNVVLCSVDWYSQQTYNLSNLKGNK